MRLGELEKQVLKYFWQIEDADAKEVYAHFSKQRDGSLNTIQSTLDRLFKKGLLDRQKQRHAFRYSAVSNQRDFISKLIREVTEDFTDGNHDGLLSAFVSLSAQLDESHLEKLEQEIEAFRLKNSQDPSDD